MDCPSEDTLGAHVQRALAAEEAEQVSSHLDRCPACQDAVLAAVRAVATPGRLAAGTPTLPLRSPRAGLPLGSRIAGRYELRALLGAGGMGQVYEAWDRELERAIALKVLRPELSGAATLTERLVRESRLMAKVAHASVITVYDVGRADDVVFIAMKLVRGETLAAYVARTRPGWREIVKLYERAGAGLAAAHAEGIIHRDFKPDNVLLGPGGEVVVTDFGIARASAGDDLAASASPERDVRLTATGAALGTPAYMAPEQLAGEQVDARADVFAFCASMWESVFGARAFPGSNVDEIRAAMKQPPRAPRRRVPRTLISALEQGLAIDPRKRWPDMPSLVRRFANLRRRIRRLAFAATAAGLVALGTVGALVVGKPSHVDRCAEPIARIDAAYPREVLRAALAADPARRDPLITFLDGRVQAWRDTQLATCHDDREPAQPAATTACLEARAIELGGFVEDTIVDGPGHANTLSGIVGDPVACANPARGQLTARAPDDRVVRRRVTALRYRLFDAEAARDRGEFASAVPAEEQIVREAAAAGWPGVHAEALYILGTTQSQGGDVGRAIEVLREATVVAETAHQDELAANAWVQLAMSTSNDEGDHERALEYVRYAEAACERAGQPPLVAAMIANIKGIALVDVGRAVEGEASLRKSVEICEHGAQWYLPQAIQGLGYLYEQQARYPEAIDAYRKALASLPKAGEISSSIVFRERLSSNLGELGRQDEAIAVAREAVAIADKSLPADNIDLDVAHLNLAQVLEAGGHFDEGLAEAQRVLPDFAHLAGGRNERYGEALSVEATLLDELGRPAEAEPLYARACDVIAFVDGDDSEQVAQCNVSRATALGNLHRHREALPLLDRAVDALGARLGEHHLQVADARRVRGDLELELGRTAAALADFQHALDVLASVQVEPGYLAAARYGLGRAMWSRDPAKGRALVEQAVAEFATASPAWKRAHDEATAWLAAH
jgi:tetratricopeptide (TPR) repeat protein